LNCRRWHPAKTAGVLRIASPVLHILSQTADASKSLAPDARGRKAAQEHFSEEVSELNFNPETYFKSSTTISAQYSTELVAHSKLGLTRGTKLL
jgi:hypothetical protein